jgi:hypothetical protein
MLAHDAPGRQAAQGSRHDRVFDARTAGSSVRRARLRSASIGGASWRGRSVVPPILDGEAAYQRLAATHPVG